VLGRKKGPRLKDVASLIATATKLDSAGDWRKRLEAPPFRIGVDWDEEQCERLVKRLASHGVLAETVEVTSEAPKSERSFVSAKTVLFLILFGCVSVVALSIYNPDVLPEQIRLLFPWNQPSIKVNKGAQPRGSLTPEPGSQELPVTAGAATPLTPTSDATALQQEISGALVRKDFVEAQRLARELIGLDPKNETYQERLVEVLDLETFEELLNKFNAGEIDDSLRGLQILQLKHQEWPDLRRLLGLGFAVKGRYDEALGQLAPFDTPELTDPEILSALGRIWEQKGDIDKAREYNLRAQRITAPPTPLPQMNNRAQRSRRAPGVR